MANKPPTEMEVSPLPDSIRDSLRNILKVPSNEFNGFISAAMHQDGAKSKRGLASQCRNQITNEAQAEAVSSIVESDELGPEELEDFLGNLKVWNALVGESGGGFSDSELELLVERLQVLVPLEPFPSIGLYNRALETFLKTNQCLVNIRVACDARPMLSQESRLEAFLPVVTLTLDCMTGGVDSAVEYTVSLTDERLEEVIGSLERARETLSTLRSELEGKSGYSWISFREAEEDDE